MQRLGRRRVKHALPALAATTLGLAGCSGDYSMLDPSGPAARDIAFVWWGMLTFFTLVFGVVVALWLAAFRRHEHRERSEGEVRRLSRRWIIGGGLLLPGVTILVLLVFGVPVGQRMLTLPLPGGEDPRVIEVIGHQWWWEVRYPDTGDGEVVTANQLVMPVGEPVDFHVSAGDVIHAFWIPRLGGKIDMLPGRVNRIRLQADQPGVFGGQCAEFCGTQHAHMKLYVEAMPPADFDTWLSARQAPANVGDDEQHQVAREAFAQHCAQCHRVAGVSQATVGPDLSDVGSRPTLGAGVMAMEDGAIARWLAVHQRLKPGNLMPVHDQLDAETLEDLGNWLETLNP
nr:cytochrome c oxidase subunit II [Halomonas korlensis]